MWFLLGILSGLFNALQAATIKKVSAGLNYYWAAFAYIAFTLPYFFLALFWLDLAPLSDGFWLPTIATSVLNVVAAILLMKALGVGELSLTMPFLSFTPVFLILTSNLMLGESPNLTGVAGIILIVVGTYILEVKKGAGFLGPFRALLENKGGQLVLLVAFIYAFSSNFDKISIEHSNAITRNIIAQAMMASMLFLVAQFKSNQKIAEIRRKYKILLLVGLFGALSLFCQMAAFTLNIVPYIISLKRTSALFSVILGVIAFKEKNIKPRLLGAALMVLGVLLISLS